MPVIDVDGDRLHFVDEPGARPDAPILLFVHGSCGGSGQWKRLTGLLPQFRTVRLDMLGMGASEPFPLERAWSPEDDRRALLALIEHLGRPFHFVGHSAGCIFSWSALQARADRVLSLTLFEPVFFGLLRGDPLFDWPARIAAEYRARVDAGDPEGAMAHFVDSWAGRPGAWAATPEKVRAMMRCGGARLYHEWARLQPEGDGLAPPSAPTLLIEGAERQPAVRAICDRLAALWPGISRRRIEGAGHMAPFSHADTVAPLLRAHVASLRNPAPG